MGTGLTDWAKTMRTVGKRADPALQTQASAEALKRAAAFNEMMQSVMPYGRAGCIPKGVYRFRTHEEANLHQDECLARHMAKIWIKINRMSP
ncbi:MAG: hypothetical protein Q8L80_06020 [Gallionella sp.]|nr:hypothetical protein [Gallionella sp.]MDP1941727.1 hypothetical protein [Gallionella sp.]